MPKGTQRVPSQAHFGDDTPPVDPMPVVGTKADTMDHEVHGQTTLLETRNLDDATYVQRFSSESNERVGYGGEAE